MKANQRSWKARLDSADNFIRQFEEFLDARREGMEEGPGTSAMDEYDDKRAQLVEHLAALI